MLTGNVFSVLNGESFIIHKDTKLVKIKVNKVLRLSESPENPIISIWGEEKIDVAWSSIYTGIVLESSNGFIKGTRVAVIGISNCNIETKEINANPKVVVAIPDEISDDIACISGVGARWINMLKISRPPLGSIIRVKGENSSAVGNLLIALGYILADKTMVADYFFPTDENSIGEGRNLIHWSNCYGAGWNDERVLSGKDILPIGYVNNSVIENIRSFWELSYKVDINENDWPLKSIHVLANSENEIYDHIIGDDFYFKEIGVFGADVFYRKKPISVFAICNGLDDQQNGKEMIIRVLALIGSLPTRVTIGDNKSFMVIDFADGSLATIQFIKFDKWYYELHFDAKSIFVDAGSIGAYDCSGAVCIEEIKNDDICIRKAREEVIKKYEEF